jgi:hypothetical protein
MTFLDLRDLLNSLPDYHLNQESHITIKPTKVPGNYVIEPDQLSIDQGFYTLAIMLQLLKKSPKAFWEFVAELTESAKDENLMPSIEFFSDFLYCVFNQLNEEDEEDLKKGIRNLCSEDEGVDFDE